MYLMCTLLPTRDGGRGGSWLSRVLQMSVSSAVISSLLETPETSRPDWKYNPASEFYSELPHLASVHASS